jgi:hypothetical protein
MGRLIHRSGELSIEGHFPSLGGATAWLDSPPLDAEGLRGKVVVVDFCTYTCINWLRTLPYVRAWANAYMDRGLVMIGVHEDLVARPEPRDLPADRLDAPGQIRTRNEVFRRAQAGAHDPEDVGHAAHHVPDVGVNRCCANPDEHLMVPDRWLVDVAELQDIR